ncbi:MATE family efflux transporter [Salmonella enterica subsp. enterica serovar Heidelberg]|nr:MATE family efflux transporter [Salmonella enterica subsp. enterica serovar Heidelberg]EGE8766548.1 MATE family efflux transporter [Salmonella enterica subsp. enterica serovar Heidelberg]EGE8803190.1 MATE family efflux transporter [Salmonella enterica subsp. enterica serovar Heidelberg]
MKVQLLKIPSHLIVAGSSWLSKIIIAGVQLASISYLISILGEEKYAIFSLLTGLLVWCSAVDFGIGTGLQNYISECRAKNKRYDAYIKSALHLSFIAIIFFIALFYIFSGVISAKYLSSFHEVLQDKTRMLFFTSCLVFSSIGIGAIAYKILFAELVGWKANLLNALSYMIGMLGLLYIYYRGISVDIKLSLIVLYLPVGMISLCYIVYRYIKLYHVKTTKSHYIAILRRSSGFFLFTLLSIVVLQTDYMVISQRLTPADIVQYTVTMKIFGLVFFIYTAILQALWPICAELRVKQQWKKLNKMIGVNILLGSLYVVGCTIFIYLFKEQIFSVIAKDINYQVSILSFMLIGIYFCIRVWCDTYAMLLQSMNYLKILWILVPLQAIIGGIAQWYFSSTLGISGVLLGLIISFALTVFWGLPLTYLIKANKG